MAAELLAVREAQSVPTGKFAGWGVYHAERDAFGSWLKSTPEADNSHAITKHGYVNVKLFTAPPAPAVPAELLDAMAEVIRISDRDHEAWGRAKAAISACRAAILQPVSQGYTLPDEMTADQMYNLLLEKGGMMSPLEAAMFAWSACRATAMAAAPTPTKAGK
ncbi:hypothetical protein [Serratia fonticola]|uniref:hypothetical protein n=1 Tax=Serratia fonticola TaxID=47917 RepID=UPI0034C601E2